jgi:RsiW-degrading membrane proteinase PrsW (M82 family)
MGTLFPVQNWLHNPGWRQWTRLMLIPYALLPLVYLIVFANATDPSAPGWAYALYIAPLWAGGFWLLIRPGPVGKQETWIAVVVIVWTVIWMNLITEPIEQVLAKGSIITAPSAIVVGVDEELTKALPILVLGLFLRGRHVKLDVRMWMFMGTIAGLAFGVVEASGYTALFAGNTLQYLTQATNVAQANNAEIQFVLGFAERVFVDGLQHAVWAGIAGFFMGIAVNYRKRRMGIIALGIGVPSLLHALNDYAVGGTFTGDAAQWVWIIIQAVSVVLFLSYSMSAHSIEEHVRDSPVFRGQSMILDVSRLRDQSNSPAPQPMPAPQPGPGTPQGPGMPAQGMPAPQGMPPGQQPPGYRQPGG